ncbi:MAG: DinB family protein [Gemmatimonadota bacterium]|nr:DinB family protein [Gemmatimonadota bacterium]
MPRYVLELRNAIKKATPLLKNIGDAASRQPREAGKWCPREVIGHLIDSASNNHQRFVRARFQDDLVFPGYDQDAWVAAQSYRDAPWDELIELWSAFNFHIARVMESTPDEQLTKSRARHNLDALAWKPVSRDKPATLDYFMSDYVAHLKHHLYQVVELD